MNLNDIFKWSATALLIIGFGLASYDVYPTGPIIQLAGGALWLVVSIRWREPALIVTNSVMTAVGIIGLTAHFLT